jgi:photosystem II stability/assembly factor-like uncharacterized protein
MRPLPCRPPRGRRLAAALLAAGAALSPLPARAAEKVGPKAPAPAALEDLPELKELKYRLLGPAWGGRVTRVAGVPGDPRIYYAAAASGGVWKSVDGGHSFKPVFDDQPVSAIGSLAVAPSDPNVLYVGTGEANLRGNVGSGNGIYRSRDGGKTWAHVWSEVGQIGRMAVDPRDADVAFAAVLGHAFGANPERGVYRTRDGGRSWQQVLRRDADTGASDVALDPSNPNIVFAGLWQVRRYPWDLASGGPGSGLYLSRDGGDTWKQLTGKGLPGGIWGKVGIAVAPSDGRRVYALIEAAEGGLFRSDDGGESWTRASGAHDLRQRAFYYSTLTVNPANPDEVWCPQVPMLKSIDGGRTFAHVAHLHHGDNHDLWIDPKNPRRMIGGNDGGVDITADGGETWVAPPLPIGQFYHVSADDDVPFNVAGALQDIGTAQGPSNSLSTAGIRDTDWHEVGGGEAGFVVSAPGDPAVVYAGEYGGYISRYDRRTGEARNVSVYPDNPSGHGGEDLLYRFQWTAPIALSPHDPKVVYHAANVLFRSADGGQTWQAISPDLTRNDRSKQRWAGGPITGDNTGVEVYGTIFAVAESPVAAGVVWAGSDDGLVHLTRDGTGPGAHWSDVTAAVPGMPRWGTVAGIEPSRFDAGTAYLVVDAHRLDDPRPYLWKTADFGRTWKRLDGGLPRDVYLHAVREDPLRRGMLWVGTERGVSYSPDDGATWRTLKLNLPTVAVHDLAIKGSSLVVATHGRSMWILDDRQPLFELSPAVMASAVHLFAAPDAVRWDYRSGHGRLWSAENPAAGAHIYYWLKSEPKGEVRMEILDAAGAHVATLSSQPRPASGAGDDLKDEEEELKKLALPKGKGVQLGTWDLSWDGAELIPGAKLDSGDPRFGPRAIPGTYTVRLTVDGETQTTALKLLPDPRSRASQADLAEQLRLSLEVRDSITRLTRAVARLRSVRGQLAARDDVLAGDAKAAPLIQGSAALIAKLDGLEGRFHNPRAEVVYDILAQKGGARLYSRLAPLLDTVKTGDGAPTQGMREEHARERRELDGDVAELDRLLGADLAELNRTAAGLALPVVYVPPGPGGPR